MVLHVVYSDVHIKWILKDKLYLADAEFLMYHFNMYLPSGFTKACNHLETDADLKNNKSILHAITRIWHTRVSHVSFQFAFATRFYKCNDYLGTDVCLKTRNLFYVPSLVSGIPRSPKTHSMETQYM